MDSSSVKSHYMRQRDTTALPSDNTVAPSGEYEGDPYLYPSEPNNDRTAKSAPAAIHVPLNDGITGPPPTRASPKGDLHSPKEETNPRKTVKFSSSPDYIQLSSAAQRKGLDLKSRLYDRPQDAQVFRMMRPSSSSSVTSIRTKQVGYLSKPVKLKIT